MSEISDKIRKWCGTCRDSCIDEDDCDELRDLADRIDLEMVELPKDADGEPIHVGDTAYLKDGREVKVIRLIFEHETPTIICSLDDNPDVVRLPFELWHERPDSFARIADELEDWSEDNRVNGDSEIFDCAADFAERIRKLANKEG